MDATSPFQVGIATQCNNDDIWVAWVRVLGPDSLRLHAQDLQQNEQGNRDIYSNKESRDRFSSIPKCTAHHLNFCRTIWDFLIITRIERGRCNVRSATMYPGTSKSFRFFKYTVFALLSQINFFYDNLELNLGLNPAEMGLSHLSVPTSSPPGTASNQGCGSGSICSGQTIEKGISIECPYSWLWQIKCPLTTLPFISHWECRYIFWTSGEGV